MEMYQRIHLKMVFRSRLHGHIGCGWHYWVSKDASARWTKNGTSAWRCLVLWIKSMAVLKIQLDGIVHTQMKIILPFTWPQSVPKLYEILSFVEHKIRYVVYMWATKQFLVPIHIYIWNGVSDKSERFEMYKDLFFFLILQSKFYCLLFLPAVYSRCVLPKKFTKVFVAF